MIDKIFICPICKKEMISNKNINKYFPFCSQRCKLIDLGKWLDGKYAIDGKTGKLKEIEPDLLNDDEDQKL